ncbi:hypothetical protein IYX23_13250 [Methylocystis sp. L43]|uniref:hypothetical protein n=1 Tax=unclassified Methylocystis TaxID=2625913 RepID=UPI0018C2B114|nr:MULTISPECIES: hypothetical protein [unclassified Methylocystis]MBG0798636.1 hypothetical protein [Methylocystis sp. L43]MBG0806951.1 hypothetical protein [Methylocystis sp. H15]
MIENIDMDARKRAAVGVAALVGVLVGLSILTSEFGRRSTAQLGTNYSDGALNAEGMLAEVRNMPQNIYGYAGGMARNVAAAAKWSEEEWTVAINAVSELRQKNEKNNVARQDDSNGAWQPPEEIRGNPN